VSTGYILASVIVIPLTGWLGDLFGRKRYFVGSILIFTASSFMCGTSRTLVELVIWRIIQGVGGGALLTVSQAVLAEAFPREKLGTGMALFGMGVMVGPTIGPTLGGYITDNFGWPWIFFINVPLGIVAALMIATYVHDPEYQRKPQYMDFTGIALLAVSVGALQYLLEHGEREDWFQSSLMVKLAIVSVVAGVLLVWRELRIRHPVIDFRVLRHRQVWVGTLLGVILGIGLFASVFTIPVFLQNNLQMTAEQTGLILMPGALMTAVSMAFIGRMLTRIDARWLVVAGSVLFAVSMIQLSHITSQSGEGDFLVPLMIRGLGLGMMFVPLTTITLSGIEPRELAQTTGIFNFFRQLGGSLGIAGIASLLGRYTAQFRSILGEHVGMFDPISLHRLSQITAGMEGRGMPPGVAHQQALSIMDRQLLGQASVLAFARVYVLSAVIALALIPLLLLLRRAQPRRGAPVVAE
jgi:DHA2 family multidrug resistance protein